MTAVRTVTCQECGNEFVARSPRARFCSAKCRKAVNRRPSKVGKAQARAAAVPKKRPAKKVAAKRAPAKRAAAKKATSSKTTSQASAPPPPVYDTLEEQVRASLEKLFALDTISGMAAVRVAQQIDRGQDSGSAVATLSKELSRLVAEAKVEAAPRIRDAADDIAARAGDKLLRLVG